MRGQRGGAGITVRARAFREADMDRVGLAEIEREIRLVEFTPEKTVTREGHGPRCHLLLSERLADARAWERPAFERLRERIQEIGQLRNEF
jgi:hypothetical protein